MFVAREHRQWIGEAYWKGADFIIEVVSSDADSQNRDFFEKRADYAAAGIQEYWIVDPQTERITQLALDGQQYRVQGEFGRGEQVSSTVLVGFAVDVGAVFAA